MGIAYLEFKVIDRNTGQHIPGATLQLTKPASKTLFSNQRGEIFTPVSSGEIRGSILHANYDKYTVAWTLTDGQIAKKTYEMRPGSPTGLKLYIYVKGGGKFLPGCRISARGESINTDSSGRVVIQTGDESGSFDLTVYPPSGSNFKAKGQTIRYSKSSISFFISLEGKIVCSPGQRQIVEYCSDGRTPKEWKDCSSDGLGWVTRVNYNCPQPKVPELDTPVDIPDYDPGDIPDYDPGDIPGYDPGDIPGDRGFSIQDIFGKKNGSPGDDKTMEYLKVGAVLAGLAIGTVIIITIIDKE